MWQTTYSADKAEKELLAAVLADYRGPNDPVALAGREAEEQEWVLDGIVDLLARCKPPLRPLRRSYPRAVRGRGFRLPNGLAGEH
jgi:hypothetical protein